MLNKVVLPYTIWYTGLEKILRLNLDKRIDTVTNISTKATLNGTAVNDLVSAIFNPTTKSIDITIRSDVRMNVDGEMEISLSYSDEKTHESILVVSVRSHENTATENPKEVKHTKLTLLNGQSYTVGAADEQVVYSFNLVDRNVTDEFATYGDVKDMLMGLGVTDNGEKDQYTILLEGDNLVLSKENDPSYRKEINLAKYHDEVSGEPLNVETLKSDILSEAATKDAQLKVDILHEVDGKIPDVSVIKSEILNEVNPKLLDKETFKQEILSAIPAPANYTLTMEEDNLVLGKEGDDSYRKVINLSKYHDEVTGQTVDVEQIKKDILAAIHVPDEATIKQNILAEINPKLIDKDTFKQEILSVLPAKDEYSLELTEDTLVLTKTNDSSYRKEINLSKYHDEVSQPINVEALKIDILSEVDIKISSIPKPVHPSKLVNDPSVTNGTLKFNTETDAPTVDLSNDFYTKAKIDELLRSTNSNNIIFGTGRPDRDNHPNNNEAAGKIYIDKNSTDGAHIWFKRAELWIVLVGDTGWINLPTLNLYDNSRIRIRRINNTIYVEFSGLAYGLFGHIPYNQANGYKPSPNVMRLTGDNAIPNGFKADNAFVGNVISDVENPGKILGSYAITGDNDLNYIKIFYAEGIPNKNVNDLRLQPAAYVAKEQPWPTL